MTARLCLLEQATWDGHGISGGRPLALLATLVAHPEGLSDARLVAQVWGDQPPQRPIKALQVLVSRLRALDPALIARRGDGYRLSLARTEIDAWQLHDITATAQRLLDGGDAVAALDMLDLAPRTVLRDETPGPLGELRRAATVDLARGTRVRGLALTRCGRTAEAFRLLLTAHAAAPQDGEVLAELLRAEADTVSVAAALTRYEQHRRELSERLGIDPDPLLQRVHLELLARDTPSRSGIHYDPDELLGRAADLAQLRASLAGGRLTTIVGPGGIGKTRVAHVLAREATQPRVWFVELVGVASGDDVVAEVGARLGIRGSVGARRLITPAQLADIRGRIAQELDSGPALLVLDNCEHVLEAVAGLVAFLLVTTRDLHVVTTSRAPLRIAAERIVPLTQLAALDAADLFTRRASAVRPDAHLDPEIVAAIVARLDGLPLAVELAAARVRTMSLEEVAAGLDDRFGLLRSRDRVLPERHRTLTAVIEWSWGLLTDAEQRAAARLSVFHDGFTSRTATAVLGAEGPDLVEALADQSFVTIGEEGGAARFRMLETVREFAALRLHASGELDAALAAQDAWATNLVLDHGSVLLAADQFTAVDVLLTEQNNLVDVLRRALSTGNAAVVAQLVASLGSLWTIIGHHGRLFAVADAARELLADWTPGNEAELEAAFAAAGLLLVYFRWAPGSPVADLREAMDRWGEPRHPWARASKALFRLESDDDPVSGIAALAAAEPNPRYASMLLLWAAVNAENAGDIAAAREHATRGLRHPDLTPYVAASLHSELAQLALYEGDHRAAAYHAALGRPILLRLHADDDAISLHITLAMAALLAGNLDECASTLAELERVPVGVSQIGSRMLLHAARGELALARGDRVSGFAHYDRAIAEAAVAVPGWVGMSPWLVIASAGALGARVLHGTGADPRVHELAASLLEHGPGSSNHINAREDLPLTGVVLVALASWALRFGDLAASEEAVRLLAIADCWAYNRTLPSLRWEPLVELAEAARPGLLDRLTGELAERPRRELFPDAVAALDRLRAVTSSG